MTFYNLIFTTILPIFSKIIWIFKIGEGIKKIDIIFILSHVESFLSKFRFVFRKILLIYGSKDIVTNNWICFLNIFG